VIPQALTSAPGAREDPCLVLEIEARPEAISEARRAMAGLGRRAALRPERLTDVAIAVGEAVSNAVEHAYPAGGGRVEVAGWARHGVLSILVSDDGEGMVADPARPARGLGLGLTLMAMLSDGVWLSTDPGHGTRVLLTFLCPAGAGG
jgi:anti-sigma regulatory factor (Ser/Thr protein kinase)